MRRFSTVLAALAIAAVVAFGAGFVEFVAVSHRSATSPPVADGIVALTGGAERVETGLRLLAGGRAKLLLISGVSHSAALAELLHRVGLEEGPIAARVTLGRVATTTLGNAEETADWVRLHDIHSLIVVTAGFHMPRALLELRREIPEVVLYAVPVQPQGVGHLHSFRLLAAEYVKLLAAWAGVSHVIRQPISEVRRHPVDKSVSG
jgi:uncharacterized SAM-binding protein YcdF (DUF218 family)